MLRQIKYSFPAIVIGLLSLSGHVDALAEKPVWSQIPCDRVLDPKFDIIDDPYGNMSKVLYCKGIRAGLTEGQSRWLAEDFYDARTGERQLYINHFKLIDLLPAMGFDGALKKLREDELATVSRRVERLEAIAPAVEKLSKMESYQDAPVFTKCDLSGKDLIFRRLFYTDRLKAGLNKDQAERYTDWIWGFASKGEQVGLLSVRVVDKALGIEEIPGERGDERNKRSSPPSDAEFFKAIRKGASASLKSLNEELAAVKAEYLQMRKVVYRD